MSQLIKSVGPATSPVMVVTDMPEQSDWIKGEIFSSKQGWLFGKMIEDAGGKMASLHITSTVKHKVHLDKKKHKSAQQITKLAAENSISVADMKAYINLIKPNVIIAVGEWPLQILTDNRGILQFQGSVLPLAPTYDNQCAKIIPIQHPRQIFKQYTGYYYTPVYLKRALKYKNVRGPLRNKIFIEIVKNYATVKNYLQANRNQPFIVSDIETFYNLISCVGISLTEDTAIVVPFLDGSISIPELCEIKILIQKAYEYFPYVNQNAVFDQMRLEKEGFRINKVIGDTMLGMSVLYPELKKNLGFVNSIFNEIPYFKDEGKGYRPGPELYNYCGKDCISTYQAHLRQQEEAEEMGVKEFLNKRLIPCIPVYKDLQNRGIQVDPVVRDDLREKYEIMLTTHKGYIKEILGRDFNPLSPKQCKELLYDELNLPVQKKRRTDNNYTDTADEDAIDFLLLNHVNSEEIRNLLQLIVATRKVEKILGYINIPLHEGDVFKTSYNLAGTETGRTSTSKSGDRYYHWNEKDGLSYTQLGYALQTIPKHGFVLADGTRIGADIRTMFVPRKGYVFGEGDQSKAEAVIVTILAQDWELYNVFYAVNLHKLTAQMVFALASLDDCNYDQYNKGKRVRHAGNYDMREATLAKQAMCSIAEAKRILTAFHEKNWRIKGIYHKQIAEFVRRHMWLNTPFGRRRDFFVNPKSDAYLRVAYAYIPQSIVGDKTKFAMVETKKKLGSIDAHFLGESHDSVLAEIREGQELDYFHVLKTEMERTVDMRKCCIPRDVDAYIKFECATGMNWKEMNEVEIN